MPSGEYSRSASFCAPVDVSAYTPAPVGGRCSHQQVADTVRPEEHSSPAVPLLESDCGHDSGVRAQYRHVLDVAHGVVDRSGIFGGLRASPTNVPAPHHYSIGA